MDGWIDGWMDRWMDGWMDGWIDDRLIDDIEISEYSYWLCYTKVSSHPLHEYSHKRPNVAPLISTTLFPLSTHHSTVRLYIITPATVNASFTNIGVDVFTGKVKNNCARIERQIYSALYVIQLAGRSSLITQQSETL